MRNVLDRLKQWWIALRKVGRAFVDTFHPSGYVVLTLRYAHGPRAGQVYKRIKGRNVVTGWLNGPPAAPPYSGRDVMRRMFIPAGFPGSFLTGGADDDDHVVHQCQLGTGTTAETSDDTQLATALAGTAKDLSSVTLDTANCYVTYVFIWSEDEANNTLAEAALLSDSSLGVNQDFLARKTFTPFTKTNEFTLEVQWTLRW